MTDRESWLNQTPEDAIEPELPICDAHHHLWYSPRDSYLANDLLSDISGGHNIVQTVCVEAWDMNQRSEFKLSRPEEETRFMVAEGNKTKSRIRIAAGIVGFADLMQGEAAIPALELQIEAGQNRFRGIRLARGSILNDKKFQEGFSCLSRYKLSSDVFINGQEMIAVVNLARLFPDVPIIVNHTGWTIGMGPGDSNREYLLEEWKKQVAKLAACENVFMKLGGFGMRPYGFGWNKQPKPPNSTEVALAIKPYCLYCIDKFEVDRCMFESNFPVDKASYSYTVLWNAFKILSKSFSCEERRLLFQDTAAKVYRL
jgi:L-fuconolactonase